MSTTSNETGLCTCLYYNGTIHHGLNEDNKDYWTSPQGIISRIDSIAQIFTYGIFNNAVKILGTTKGAKWLEWVTMGDDQVCPTCMGNAAKGQKGAEGKGTGFFKSGWFMPDMPAHPGCFAPGTQVNTHRGLVPIETVQVGDYVLTHRNKYQWVRQTHKRRFKGKLYWLLSCGMTGNHPILTPDGWHRADSVNDGDQVLTNPGTLNPDLYGFFGHLKPDAGPSTVAEKNLFTSIISPLNSGVMPVAPIDLDGQFQIRDSKINVIGLESVLRDNIDRIPFKSLMEPNFEGREFWIEHLGLGLSPSLLKKYLTTLRCFMSSPNLGSPLLGSHSAPLDGFSFALPSNGYTTDLKPRPDGASTDFKPLGDSILGETAFIETNNIFHWKLDPYLHYSTPTLNNTYTTEYKGYVYNLTVDEDESYTVGESRLIVHNCRCQWRVYWER